MSWKQSNGYGEEEQDDEEEKLLTDDTETRSTSRDCILFVIDCSKAMRQETENGEVPVMEALKCALTSQLNKIISSDTDLTGLLLYGLDKPSEGGGPDNMFIHELDIAGAERISFLKAVDDQGMEKFEEVFGPASDEYKLGEVFSAAMDMFSRGAQRVGSKRLFLFTNEDNPHSDPTESSVRNATKTRAQDLASLGIRLELFDMNKDEAHQFNKNLFYTDILDQGGDDEEEELSNGFASYKFQDLLKRVIRKEVKKRSLFKIPLLLSPGLVIGVKGYNMVMSQTKGTHKNVILRDHQVREVVTHTNWICTDTSQFLLPPDMKRYWEFGGSKVLFAPEEVTKLKTFGEPGLELIGFKDRKVIRMDYHINHNLFLYPDETSYEGSTRAFASLLTTLVDMDKVAICAFTQRVNHMTRLVALVPQLETVTEDEEQEQPPGFQLVGLPWADDIRPLHIETSYMPPVETVDAAKAVVQRLTMKRPYHPENYKNPVLQKHFQSLQAAALNAEIEEIEDATLPNTEQMRRRAGRQLTSFKVAIEAADLPEDEVALAPAPAPARARASTVTANADQDDDGGAAVQAEVRALSDSGSLSKATVAVLKRFLNSVQVRPEGKKADLIQQVESYYAAQ